jgi:hypothetical protein
LQDFTTISAKAVAAGNLTKQEKGWWFIQGLPTKYRRHAIETTGAVADKPSTLIFKRLKRAVESRIIATENAKRIAVLPEEDVLNVQLIQELRQQRNELDHRRDGRLLNPVRPGVRGGALTQEQSPTTDQEMDEMVDQLKSLRLRRTELAVATRSMPFINRIRMDLRKLTTPSGQSIVQSPALGYKDWQNSTRPPQDLRPPQDFRYPQDSRYPQDCRPPQGSQYPQDSTTFRRPQRDAPGQQGTRGQGR